LVWDKAAEIEFVKACRTKVTSVIKISESDLSNIRSQTAGGNKYFPEFMVEIRDEEQELVAKVRKTLYVKRKPVAVKH
ncbi:MAG: DUF4442 domain-containing protein, partial [Marinobacter sp.]|uniref:DUF4442 domain-containing protein n=1 Tax=Marinobacter sp. TaxID=50741 RepID=UPI00299E62FB